MNIKRIGSTVILDNTRIDCSYQGKPSVTGAQKLERLLVLAKGCSSLLHSVSTAHNQTLKGRNQVARRAQILLKDFDGSETNEHLKLI